MTLPTFLLAALAASCGAGPLADEAVSVVRVRPTPGGPQVFADGAPVPPRMFWGRRGVRPLPMGSGRWTRHELTFAAPVDAERVNVHFRFEPVPGGAAGLRNVSLKKGGAACGPGFADAFADAADPKNHV